MRRLLFFIAVFCGTTATAQPTIRQSITTAWGNYVNTNVYGYGNTLLQVSVDGQNTLWHGVFSINGTNSFTPDVTWNNVKLIAFSSYNAVADDVQVLIMSNTPTTSYGGTTIVIKLEPRAIGSATITAVATTAGAYTSPLSLTDNSTSAPFTYTMASSAGTYNIRLDLNDLKLGPISSFPAEGSILEGVWGNYIIGDVTTSQKLRLGVSNDGYSRAEIFLDNSNRQDGTIAFKTVNGGAGALTRMFINGDGNVGIGTTSINDANYRLYVENGIRTRKVKVDQAAWADYVFHRSYQLRPLSEVEHYIQQYRHLPEVPTAAEVEKEGLDLGDSQTMLLKKIEELTLYLIDVNKKVEQLQQENQELKKLVKNQK